MEPSVPEPPPRPQFFQAPAALISTNCVSSIGRRGRNPGATSSRRCAGASREWTSGPRVEAFGLDQARVRPQRVVEMPVGIEQFGIGAARGRRSHAPR